MLTEQESSDLMNKLIALRIKAKELKDPKIISELERHERLCIEKFKYLILMKTSRYKSFSNYDDLNQEGFVALLKAMKTFNPKKGCFFSWAHHYISTRISRSANLHTTIRYPLKIAKEISPHKEPLMPIMVEHKFCPDKELELCQMERAIHNAIDTSLTNDQKEIIKLAYGFNNEKPMSINKICNTLNISRINCIKSINNTISIIKDNIKL